MYGLGWHIKWLDEENAGLGLMPEPTQDLMYVESYSIHVTKFEFNV